MTGTTAARPTAGRSGPPVEASIEGPCDGPCFPIRPPRHTAEPAGETSGEVGDGPLGRALGALGRGAGLTLLLAAANAPLVLSTLLLRPEPSLTWLVALCALALGPAMSAGLWTVREHHRSPDVGVLDAFRRGYRLGWRDALVTTAPACLVGWLLVTSVAGGPAAGVPDVVTGVARGAGVLLLVLTLHALALRTFFRLRPAAAWALAAHQLVRSWRSSIATLALVAGAVAVATLTSDVLLTALGGLWAALWYRAVAPMLRTSGAAFLADADGADGVDGTAGTRGCRVHGEPDAALARGGRRGTARGAADAGARP
ncbi:hypothetical protein EDD28_3056 [Salana multivorans]|uniref:Membrane protein YesL n=1 Tax=Salana multivorans TaxID=120377 RepID=A0A3N2D2D6_9MICO|nr:hypothetical protein EDD28_3056 [Salana multivorans]